jgi:hypothetical protein
MTETDAVATAREAAPEPPRRRRLGNAVRLAIGLGLGLAIAEGAFWVRDGGAFPHINVYVPDGERGVRLAPGASQRIRFSKNPVTSVRINSEGYRGADWPAPAANEVIVVGDSQVLGLGVEENETFASILQVALGGTVVRNLGVPTYGPLEYNAVVDEALKKRPASTVVYVVNLANDLFEASRPNTQRHAVWDGWAVRKETAPTSVVGFPGRSLLYTQSHAFFALRGYLNARATQNSEQGFASEGTWLDIGDAASAAQRERANADAEAARLAQLRDAKIKYATDAVDDAARQLDGRLASNAYKDLEDENWDFENESFMNKEALLRASSLNPGDIVTARSGENSRDVQVNAEHIRRGALLRLAIEKKVKAKAEQEKDKESLALFQKRDATAEKLAELRAAGTPKVVAMSPLAPVLRAVKATCDQHRARLLVVALPIDVQVSKAEWTKYGVAPVDMEPTKVLNEDVVVAANEIGAEGFDAMPALSAAEPGAFLDGDLHMTPKGHHALGEAIARVLLAPKPVKLAAGLPLRRSWPPKPEEWSAKTEINVRESDPAGCETKQVREWLGIFCRQKGGARGVTLAAGTEARAGALPGQAVLIAPLIPGQDVKATFAFEGSARDFTVHVGQEIETAEIGFSKALPAREGIAGPGADATALCTCWTAQNPGTTCASAAVIPDEDCTRTYGSDCTKLLACAAGDPAASPHCAPGQVAAGAAHRCRPLCSKDTPCKTGRCLPWQGAEVCL